jgi:hypothetical protein
MAVHAPGDPLGLHTLQRLRSARRGTRRCQSIGDGRRTGDGEKPAGAPGTKQMTVHTAVLCGRCPQRTVRFECTAPEAKVQTALGAPWQRLYFFPEPQGHNSLRDGADPTAWPAAGRLLATCAPGEPGDPAPGRGADRPLPRKAAGVCSSRAAAGASRTVTGVSPRPAAPSISAAL